MALGIVVATTVLFWPHAQGVFTMPKAAVLVGGAGLLLALGVGRAVARGTVEVPSDVVVVAAGLHLVGLVAATFASDAPMLSLVGSQGRAMGTLALGAGVVLLLAIVGGADLATVDRHLAWVGGAVGLVGAVAALQWAGLDPTGTADDLRRTAEAVAGDPDVVGRVVGSVLGNPNQVGAVLAIGLPALVTLAVRTRGPACAAWVTASLLAAVGIVAADAVQGPVAAAAGLAVLAVTVARARPDRWAVRIPAAVVAIGVVGAVVVGLGAAGTGPAGALADQESLRLRSVYWDVGFELAVDHPVVGVGPDRYEEWFRQARDPEDAREEPLAKQPDAAHDVALHLAATGGLVTAVPWVAASVGVAWLVVGRWRRGRTEDEGQVALGAPSAAWTLGAVAGCWAAYQVQALVSLDTPPLVALQWWMAGAVVVVTGRHRPWRLRLPGGGRLTAGITLATAVAVTAAVLVSRPVRADLAAGRGIRGADIDQAMRDLGEASALAWWEPEYPFRLALARSTQSLAAAYDSLLVAHDRDPRRFDVLVSLARSAAQLDRLDEARRWYAEALRVEPHHPDLAAEAAGV